MMAMLQLFIAPLMAALLTLWAAMLAFAAESDADLPRALGGESDTDGSVGSPFSSSEIQAAGSLASGVGLRAESGKKASTRPALTSRLNPPSMRAARS